MGAALLSAFPSDIRLECPLPRLGGSEHQDSVIKALLTGLADLCQSSGKK